ncbi:MAG: DUF302 domain-containing protein [Candidatus Cyclobacteriaceae bacterium M3_2C_046]
MKYFFNKEVSYSFDETIEKLTAALKEEGFGILTEIDMSATLKKKLDVDFKRYTVLGACNPKLAYEALQKEDKIGLMLPCNVLVEESDSGKTEVAAVDPVVSMQGVGNASLEQTASEVRNRLQKVIEAL